MDVERSISICVFKSRGRILAAPGLDRVKNERFYRPIGGEIEAGESPVDALRREVLEETGLAIENVRPIAELDNRFTFEGGRHRELVYVFNAEFVDRSVYDRPHIEIHEDVWEGPAEWLQLGAVPTAPIYPDGLIEVLQNAT